MKQLLSHLIKSGDWHQVLVFTRMKHGANRLAEYLNENDITAMAIHGNKSQTARTRALADFKAGELQVLVATDIAARGIDIDQLPHVVNFEMPNVPEDYVHRIGRTGRAGAQGEAISLVCVDEHIFLRDIEKPDQASGSRAKSSPASSPVRTSAPVSSKFRLAPRSACAGAVLRQPRRWRPAPAAAVPEIATAAAVDAPRARPAAARRRVRHRACGARRAAFRREAGACRPRRRGAGAHRTRRREAGAAVAAAGLRGQRRPSRAAQRPALTSSNKDSSNKR